MGNVFMPSVASSLNQASGDSLLQILQQRALEQEMQKQLFSQQRQGQQDMLGMSLKLQGHDLAERKFKAGEQARVDKVKADGVKADAATRAATNVRGARDIFTQGVQQGASREALTGAALDGNVPVSLMPKAPAAAKPTLDERIAERKALRTADKEVDARFKEPKATKVAKDNPSLPGGFKAAIRGRVGTTGFETAEKALESITAKWPAWRQNYGDLDLSSVKSEIENIYGKKVATEGGGFILSAGDAAAIARARAEAAKGVQR